MFPSAGYKWWRPDRTRSGRTHPFLFGWGSGLVLLLLVLFAWPVNTSAQEKPQLTEYELKAGILSKLHNFTIWPAEDAPKVRSKIVLGIFGEDPFGALLRKAVANQSKPKIEIRLLDSPEQAAECQVVFISKSARDQLPRILEVLKGKRVLTVADLDGFAQAGGMINLVIAGEYVRLELNLRAVDEAGLRLNGGLGKYAVLTIPKKDD